MSRFNLDGGAVKAKKQFQALDDAINYYASVGHALPEPLVMFKNDFDLLMKKAKEAIKKKGDKPPVDIRLFYRGSELSGGGW